MSRLVRHEGWLGICQLIVSAKNVALAGVKTVTIYDPNPVEIADLGTQVCTEYR